MTLSSASAAAGNIPFSKLFSDAAAYSSRVRNIWRKNSRELHARSKVIHIMHICVLF
jgi:hypothetical protein